MIAFLLWALNQLVDAYILVIVVWCIMSWFPNARNSRLGDVINRLVEPYMHWFDFIPPIGDKFCADDRYPCTIFCSGRISTYSSNHLINTKRK